MNNNKLYDNNQSACTSFVVDGKRTVEVHLFFDGMNLALRTKRFKNIKLLNFKCVLKVIVMASGDHLFIKNLWLW